MGRMRVKLAVAAIVLIQSIMLANAFDPLLASGLATHFPSLRQAKAVRIASGADPGLAAYLAIEGDVAYGAYLASGCLTCHQPNGAGKGIPSITNLPVKDFLRALQAYKNKTRASLVMQLIASSLKDEEMAALAAYFTAVD